MSKILGNHEIKLINRFGDLVLPKSKEFPSFSETNCVAHIDDIISYTPSTDLADLKSVLKILYFMPEFVLKFIIKKMEHSEGLPEFLATLFRQLDIGLRGIIFSLYYSEKVGENYLGQTPLEIIGYEINRVPK